MSTMFDVRIRIFFFSRQKRVNQYNINHYYKRFPTPQVTNHLFQEPANDYGKDLASINIQRAREHGIPGYPSWRQHCKLPPIKTWSSMLTDISNATVKAYYDLYTSPEDVDLWSAGVSERSVEDSVVGPTFNCIIAKTFSDLKKGDRFWYENPGLPNSFSLGNIFRLLARSIWTKICHLCAF